MDFERLKTTIFRRNFSYSLIYNTNLLSKCISFPSFRPFFLKNGAKLNFTQQVSSLQILN